MLKSLRKNIESMASNKVIETYVYEYHKALEKLQAIGIDISEFRIPDAQLKHIDTAVPMYQESKRVSSPKLSKEKYVDKPFILMKLDTVLGYFEIKTSEKPRDIGFKK